MSIATAQEAVREIELYEHQYRAIEALDLGVRYTALGLGTGAGKTYFGPLWLMYLISRDAARGHGKDAKYIALGPTWPMARDILKPLLEMHFEGTDLEGYYHASRAEYELPTGGKIFFRSADKPQRIEGHHCRGLWVDEPSGMRYAVWPIIQARSAFHSAPVLFTGHPVDVGWYYQQIYLAWAEGDRDFLYLSGPSTANPEYSQDEFEKAGRRLPKWLYDMRHKGLFSRPAGLVYPQITPDLYVDPFPIASNVPVYVVLDPGVFYAVLFLAWIDGHWFAIDEYYEDEVKGADVHAEEIKSRLQGAVQGYLYDPARKTDIENLKIYKLGPFRKASNAVQPGIETVHTVVNDGRFHVFRGKCPQLMDQAGRYSYPTDPMSGAIIKGNPLAKDDHLPDCLRYGLHTYEGGGGRKQARVAKGRRGR